MASLPTITDLPEPYVIGIGKVIVKHAFVERQLQKIGYMLLGIGPKQGRVAVRSPRGDEHVSMIEQIMGLEGITAEGFDLNALKKTLSTFQRYRDLIAHGVWLHDKANNQIAIQDISGNWRPDPQGPKVARRISPQGILITAESLEEFAAAIGRLSADINVLHQALGAQVLALRKKRHERTPPDRLPDDQTPNTPQDPQKPSEG